MFLEIQEACLDYAYDRVMALSSMEWLDFSYHC